jgi:hypothetical protein
MHKVVGMIFLLIGTSVFTMGAITPEIDPASAGSAIALVSGALLIYRGRRK